MKSRRHDTIGIGAVDGMEDYPVGYKWLVSAATEPPTGGLPGLDGDDRSAWKNC